MLRGADYHVAVTAPHVVVSVGAHLVIAFVVANGHAGWWDRERSEKGVKVNLVCVSVFLSKNNNIKIYIIYYILPTRGTNSPTGRQDSVPSTD